MHTYRKTKDGQWYLYTVGFESADGTFRTMEDFSNEEDARKLVHFLNGGKASEEK